MCYTKSVSKFVLNYYVRKKELFNLKDWKLHQVLCVDQTSFLRPGDNVAHSDNVAIDSQVCFERQLFGDPAKP